MWKRQIAAIVFASCLPFAASAQEGATSASSPHLESPTISADDTSKRIQAFITLLAVACTPELVEQARHGNKACALIWYSLDANQSTARLPNALAKTGYRPIVGVAFSEDGDPLKAIIRVAHPQTGLVSIRSAKELATGMTIEYAVRGSETLTYHYSVVGVIFPALCKSYPDKCGMKTYRPRVFDLREYREDMFDPIAPGRSTGLPSPVPN